MPSTRRWKTAVRAGVPGVLGEKEMSRTASSYRCEDRQAWFNAVLPLLFVAKPGEPGQGPAGIRNPQNRYRLFHEKFYLDASRPQQLRGRPEVSQFAGAKQVGREVTGTR